MLPAGSWRSSQQGSGERIWGDIKLREVIPLSAATSVTTADLLLSKCSVFAYAVYADLVADYWTKIYAAACTTGLRGVPWPAVSFLSHMCTMI
jgi:hypothetical protein